MPDIHSNEREIKVLHLHESITIHGGAEVYISQLQKLLPKWGIVSYWLSVTNSDDTYSLTGSENKIIQTGGIQQIITALKIFISEHGIDIINIHSIFENELIRFCLSVKPVIKFSHSPIMVCPGRDKFWRHSERICNIKYGFHCFYHIYSEGCANRHPKRIWKAWRSVNFETTEAAEKYKKIVVMSEYMKIGLLECGVPDEKITINPYFTDFRQLQSKGQEAGQKRILFMGRLISSKGAHILLKSVSNLLKSRSDLFLDIVGDGLMLDELKAQVLKDRLEEKVIFHGWRERKDIDSILANSYIVAFPSIYPEAFGIVGIEAMMHGKPVVAFNVGGVNTWLKNGVTGYSVTRNDSVLMGEKIKELIDNKLVYERMSTEAHRQAVENFTPDLHLKKLVDLYKIVL